MTVRNEIEIVKTEEGVVLVMVLIVLVATIIMGIMLTRSSFFETKISGNQRSYKNAFYATEGASDYLISDFDRIMNPIASPAQGVPLNLTSTLPTANPISGATLTLTFDRSGVPPVGSGTSAANTFANYYLIDSNLDQQNIRVGIWKAFPKAN